MTFFVIALVLAALTGGIATAVHTVGSDGYGSVPAPRRAQDDWGTHGVSSLPYAGPQVR